MRTTKVLIGIIIALIISFVTYVIIEQKSRDAEREEARTIELDLRDRLNSIDIEKQNKEAQAKRVQDSLLTAGLIAAENRRSDSLLQLQNNRDSIEHTAFAFDRINQFGQKYMKEVSPNSGENLEVQIDPASLQYDPVSKIISLPFEAKWDAYMYGPFVREDSKSKHEFSGVYKLMNNYDEYIETIYQNYALLEGIKTNRRFQNTVRDLGNIAEILDKVDKIKKTIDNEK